MNSKMISITLIAMGLIVFIVSIAADALGIGSQTGMGWKQISGAVVGIGIALAGYWNLTRKGG